MSKTALERATWILNYADNTQSADRTLRLKQIAAQIEEAIEEYAKREEPRRMEEVAYHKKQAFHAAREKAAKIADKLHSGPLRCKEIADCIRKMEP